MTLSFLWAACASSAPPSATAADFERVAQAERALDIAHAEASRGEAPCASRTQAARDADVTAQSICALADERADADLVRRCDGARRLAGHADSAASVCAMATEDP